METRKLKISFNKSGSGSTSSSIRIPMSWLKELGLNQENREVNVTFNNNKIIIEKEGNDMLNKLKNELLNESVTLLDLDNLMMNNGFYSIFDDGVINEVLEDGDVVYGDIIISFDMIFPRGDESLIKIINIEYV